MDTNILALLKTTFADGSGTAFMTAAEGKPLVDAGLITVNATVKHPTIPESYQVNLSDAGLEAFTADAPPTPPNAPPTPPSTVPTPENPVGADDDPTDDIGAIRMDVPLPPAKKRDMSGIVRKSQFKFGDLGEPTVDADGKLVHCHSFHVKPRKAKGDKPAETVDALEKRMSSNLSAAHKKFSVAVTDENGQQVTESYKKRTYLRHPETGEFYDDPETGKRACKETDATRVVTKRSRQFVSRVVDATDPEGEGVRVFRVPLEA